MWRLQALPSLTLELVLHKGSLSTPLTADRPGVLLRGSGTGPGHAPPWLPRHARDVDEVVPNGQTPSRCDPSHRLQRLAHVVRHRRP